MNIPYGYCHCGCGQRTTVASANKKSKDMVKGRPMRFVQGHGMKGKRGAETFNWAGGKHKTKAGYIQVCAPDHPRTKRGRVFEHIIIAEKALGRYLKGTEEIHHMNGKKDDNRPENLVICPDRAYHMLLHQRQRALEACGHADWRKCRYCGDYDDPSNMWVHGSAAQHPECQNRYRRNRNKAANEASL